MTRSVTPINLSDLPAPQAITPVSSEHELSTLLNAFRNLYPDFDALVESDPVMKLLEIFAYRLAVEKQRRNEAIQAVMLAYARGSDLDQLGANVNVSRLTITPADPSTIPPTAARLESDEDFRLRIQLSPEHYSTAGSSGSYEYWAKTASGLVADVQVVSPNPGEVVVYVMSRNGDGSASDDLLSSVTSAVNADDVRPLTDQVSVKSVTVVNYTISAQLEIQPGPDADVVLKTATDALDKFTESARRIGNIVATSGVYAALQQSGVRRVILNNWSGDIKIDDGQVSYCTSRDVSIANASAQDD